MIVAKNLIVGKAAEFLVCYDLSLRGVRASLSPFEGAPYDVIGEYGGKMVKIQVKGAAQPRSPQFGEKTSKYIRYRWFHSTSNSDADLIAYVALDIGAVMYEVPSKKFVRERSMTVDKVADSSRSEKALAAVFGPLRHVE